MDEETFWDIIENEFGYKDIDLEAPLGVPYPTELYTVIQPAPGIIVMISKEYRGDDFNAQGF